MKYILFSLLSILLLCSCKEKNTESISTSPKNGNKKNILKIYKTAQYVNGIFYRNTYDTLKLSNETIDIHLFEKHFHHPYYLPDTLISSQHKDTVITVWSKPQTKENHESNWSHTYTYDSLGRITNYFYSSCLACSDFNFDCVLTYDKAGRISSIMNIGVEKYKIYYNETGQW